MDNPERPNTPTLVNLQTRVTLELLTRSGERESMEFSLVKDNEADFYAGFLGLGTPLARVILGKAAGSTVPYRMGDYIEVRILDVAPAQQTGAGEGAAKRQAEARQALEQINRTDAMIFASTVEGKWGEYDTDAIEKSELNPPSPGE